MVTVVVEVEERWECDGTGCGFVGRKEQVEKHILDQFDADFNRKTATNCSGSVLIGSYAWYSIINGEKSNWRWI